MTAPTSEDPQAPVRVLLVDDVEPLRKLYRRVLEDRGLFEVVAEAGDGREAIGHADTHEPDVVLLDISMPGMDGLEALTHIRDVSPESEVVMLSGFRESRIGDEARQRGASAYLEKGDDPHSLVQRLGEVVGHPTENGTSTPLPDRAQPSGPTPSDEEIRTFALAASHDLQEPLRMVASYLDLLEETCCGSQTEEAQELFGHARSGIERMQSMVDGLLAYSRVETRPGELSRVALDEILDEALANLSMMLDESQAVLTREALPRLPVERVQIIQLFQNLVNNAIKFHDGTPSIHIAAEEARDAWVITVADDGPGIPAEEHERLFSLLERGSSASGTKGHGLGLAICHRIVERHGGRIWIEPAPGDGTTICVELPKHTADEAGSSEVPG